jgi:ABC-2 type transport system ATP-binding protein
VNLSGSDRTALLVDRLTKTYADGTHALDGLELSIPAGSFFGLLGPNGAGKTTLIGSVAGLVRAPAGRIFVFGHDAVSDTRARLLIGLAPQEVHLDRFLTARDVLVYTAATSGWLGAPPKRARTSCSRSSISPRGRRRSRIGSRVGCAGGC